MKEDLILAQNILNNGSKDRFDRIYPFTTENTIYSLSNIDIEDKNCLTVLGSSAQAFDIFINNPKSITTFDLNPLTKYYFYFVKAFIKSNISVKEYIKFFNSDCEYSDKIYKKISDNLDNNYKKFWDDLYYFNGNEVFMTGKLFHNIERNKDNISKHSSFLNKENLDKLRDKIDTLDIEFINSDITELDLKENYDLMYFSNIMQYCEDIFHDDELNSLYKFKDILLRLSNNLNKNGEMICNYFYYFDELDKFKSSFNKDNLTKVFNDANFSYDLFPSYDNYNYNGSDAILIYRK